MHNFLAHRNVKSDLVPLLFNFTVQERIFVIPEPLEEFCQEAERPFSEITQNGIQMTGIIIQAADLAIFCFHWVIYWN